MSVWSDLHDDKRQKHVRIAIVRVTVSPGGVQEGERIGNE